MQMVPVPPGNMSYSRSYKIGIEDLDQVGIGDLSEVWNYYGQTSQQEPNVVCKHKGMRAFWVILGSYHHRMVWSPLILRTVVEYCVFKLNTGDTIRLQNPKYFINLIDVFPFSFNMYSRFLSIYRLPGIVCPLVVGTVLKD